MSIGSGQPLSRAAIGKKFLGIVCRDPDDRFLCEMGITVSIQLRRGKAIKPRVTVMSLRAKRSNLIHLGVCHPATGGTNAPRNDRASPRVTEAIHISKQIKCVYH